MSVRIQGILKKVTLSKRSFFHDGYPQKSQFFSECSLTDVKLLSSLAQSEVSSNLSLTANLVENLRFVKIQCIIFEHVLN